MKADSLGRKKVARIKKSVSLAFFRLNSISVTVEAAYSLPYGGTADTKLIRKHLSGQPQPAAFLEYSQQLFFYAHNNFSF